MMEKLILEAALWNGGICVSKAAAEIARDNLEVMATAWSTANCRHSTSMHRERAIQFAAVQLAKNPFPKEQRKVSPILTATAAALLLGPAGEDVRRRISEGAPRLFLTIEDLGATSAGNRNIRLGWGATE